jgi:hypothetical protein
MTTQPAARRHLVKAGLAALAAMLLPMPALALEAVLDGPAGAFSGGPVIVSHFTFAAAVTSVVRIIAGIFALFMATKAAHGYFMVERDGGNIDKLKTAQEVLHGGLTGLVITLAIVSFGGFAVEGAFGLIGLH